MARGVTEADKSKARSLSTRRRHARCYSGRGTPAAVFFVGGAQKMDLTEYSRKVVQKELTWISRHASGNPPQWRRVLLRLQWLMRNLGIRRRGRKQTKTLVTEFELG
jgi:hypothetical protein